MEFIRSEFQASSGDVVVVSLDRQANVRLFDATNFSRFQSGQNCEFIGGRALRSPIRLSVPRSGTWYVVIEEWGVGTIRYGIQIGHRR